MTPDPELGEPEPHSARATALNVKTAAKTRASGYFKIFSMVVLSILTNAVRFDEMAVDGR